jgi:hypothetical protein
MQNVVRNALLVFVFALTLFSCKEPEVQESTDQVGAGKVEIIDFRGEKVVIPANFPKELLDHSQASFDRYYETVSGSSNSRSFSEGINITYEELLPILIKHNAKFPTITSEEGILEKDLKRIFSDFPTIETHKEANDKRVIIYEYYQTLCKRDVVLDVIQLENATGKNGRITELSPGSLTTPEKNHLLLNPGFAQWYIQAANDVKSLTQTFYGNQDQGNKGNAFKHSTWNALTIRYILKGSPASENQAIDFTQDGTSKHEQLDNGDQIHDKYTAMDLHNNMSAREWMENETKWGIGPLRSMPSVDDIINTMLSRANSSAMHPMIDILNWHGGDNPTTWNNLYDNMYGPHQHLVHVEP